MSKPNEIKKALRSGQEVQLGLDPVELCDKSKTGLCVILLNGTTYPADCSDINKMRIIK